MNAPSQKRSLDTAALVIALLLLVLAAVLGLDALSMRNFSGYGIGPSAMTYIVAGGLALLGLGHLVVAFRSSMPEREVADWSGVAHVIGGLLAVIALLYVNGGFVIPMTILFVATARGFGRRALLTDTIIGIVVAVIVYLAFTKLLTLSLPQGPLERLIS